MAKKVTQHHDYEHEPSAENQGTKKHKLSVDYNLEKDPLQTGETEDPVSLREEAAMSGDFWTVQRRMAGKLALVFIVLILVIGGIVIWRLWNSVPDIPVLLPE